VEGEGEEDAQCLASRNAKSLLLVLLELVTRGEGVGGGREVEAILVGNAGEGERASTASVVVTAAVGDSASVAKG